MAIVVDTNVISFFQKRDTRDQLYADILNGEEKLISFMTWAELLRWPVERSWSSSRRTAFFGSIRESSGIVHSDDRLCQIWADILSNARKTGRTIATADAWIGAVAVMFDIPLVTHNSKHFENIPNIRILSNEE